MLSNCGGRVRSQKDAVYDGAVGIYIGTQVRLEGQELYFPLIDIDGDPDLEESEIIEDAGMKTLLALQAFEKLGVREVFRVIAKGGSGYRLVSNILLNKESYMAFADFIHCEMPDIFENNFAQYDTPRQLFAYQGNQRQSEIPIDAHSVELPFSAFINCYPTSDEYLELTRGKADPEEFISSVERLLQFIPITDLGALNGLGKKLGEYQKALKTIAVNPLNYVSFRRQTKPISLETMHELLKGKRIHNRIEKRGNSYAISFQGLPCPSCGKTNANARAHPPFYTLKCFNARCKAHKGIPLKKWAGFSSGRQRDFSRSAKDLLPSLPTQFISLEEARELIKADMGTLDDSLILVTPGVGKSHVALSYLADNKTDKVVLYSSFNRDLQREAYEKIKTFSGQHDRFHLLESREDLCYRKEELKEVTMRGFSPAEILCTRCAHREKCTYYTQRKDVAPGIYFVTHHMLQYLQAKFPAPDLIVLDENLIDGFRLEDSCSERQMRSLALKVENQNFYIVQQILGLSQNLSIQVMQDKMSLILNARKLTPSMITEDTVVGLLSKQNQAAEAETIAKIKDIVSQLESIPKRDLFESGVDNRAITWLKGCYEPYITSFLKINAKGDVRFAVKHLTPLGYTGTPIKVLDATGDRKVVARLTGRSIRVAKADVHWKIRGTHIIVNTSRSVLKKSHESDLRRLLTEMLQEITAEKVMVLTYKFLSKKVSEICRQIAPVKTFMDFYFLGPRGINQFKECGAVLVIGLPYRNLDNSFQDAFILFPGSRNESLRDNWIDANMLWEFIQSIHRVRPVNKAETEIVIAASYWPGVLEPPGKTIDKGRNKNWKEDAIERLEPLVKELGFLNPDVGYLANVYVKSKEKLVVEFRRKFLDVITALNSFEKGNSIKLKATPLLIRGKEAFGFRDFTKERNSWSEKEICISNLILVLYIIYYYNLFCTKNISIENLFRCHELISQVKSIKPLSLSNTSQWSELEKYFKENYKTYEEFKIRLPFSRNRFVHGIGSRQRVTDFYNELSKFKIFGNIDTTSYTQLKSSHFPGVNKSLPSNQIIVYFPEKGSDFFYVGYKDQVRVLAKSRGPISLNTSQAGDPFSIITNDGKAAADVLKRSNFKAPIHDLFLTEGLICNGNHEKRLTLQTILARYRLPGGFDMEECIYLMSDLYFSQMKKIAALNLQAVYELESRCIPVPRSIELAGIQIDPLKMIEYEDFISTDPAREHELEFLRRYIEMTGEDYRIRDSINQLGTVTGRLTRDLQTVPKGELRRCFVPRQGYRFVRGDYSQFELRIIVGLSKEPKLKRLFEEGRDVYAEIAKVLFGKERGQDPGMRKLAKSIVLGLNNGMTAYGIQGNLAKAGFSLPLDVVKEFVDRYDSSFPGFLTWRDETVTKAREDKVAKTELGRRLIITSETRNNQITNFSIQGTASDGFKRALIELDDKLRNFDGEIVHVVHDEIIIEAREDQAEEVSTLLRESMENSFKEIIPNVLFEVTPDITNSWG